MKLASVIVILVSVVTIRYPVATQDLPPINPDNLDPGAAHVCQNTTKTESHTRQVAFTQYYIKKTYKWCVSFPPRCTEYRLASRTSYRIETSDRLGPGYDISPHERRDFGFRSTFHTANRPFRTSSAFLPKWLNFKSENGRRVPRKPTSQEFTPKTEQKSKIHETNESRNGQLSARSKKAKCSAFRMRGGLDEPDMKTNPNKFKKDHDNKGGREQRMFVERKKMRHLRIIRQFYLPSLFCIALGTVFILGSSVHSIGSGTIFWDLHRVFRIIGPTMIVIGVILLLAIVGCENRSSEKLKKKGVITKRNPLIHSDFLKVTDMKMHISKQPLTRYFAVEGQRIKEYRLVQTDPYIKDNISLVSTSANCTLADSPRPNGAEKPQIHQKKTNNTEEDDVGFYFCNSHTTSRDHMTKTNGGDNCIFQRAMSDISVDYEVFVRSDMKSRHSSADVKEATWQTESNYGGNDDVFCDASQMRQNDGDVRFIGNSAGFVREAEKKIKNINGTCRVG